jgi:hypothetical protein
MAEPILWEDNPGVVKGSTIFGYFDNSTEFQVEAPQAARWAAKRLGYPSIDVEMESGSFYACYEEAGLEYSSQVQAFTIRENMMSLLGTSNDIGNTSYVNYTTKPVYANLETLITISDNYGAEAGVGGNVSWHKQQLYISHSVQDYDLNELIAAASGGNEAIEIKRVYHYEPVAYGYGLSGVYNAPGVLGTAGQAGTYGLLGNFGWEGLAAGGIATGLSYTLMPVYEDLLRMQAVEFNFQMRRSGYSFEVRNNQLRIFPVPLANQVLWVEWVYVKDKRYGSPNELSGSVYTQGSGSSVTTNIGDAPFTIMDYDTINGPAKRWIMKYYFACCKDTLGEIRSKYQTIPIPGSELTLNGDALKQEAQQEKEMLITLLREDLERTSTQTQMLIQAENAENLLNTLNKVPQGIFVG